jgi:hypothetical protein
VANRIGWIEHKGKRILHLDYSNLRGEEYVKAIEDSTTFQLKHEVSTVLVLCDVTNTYTTDEIKEASVRSNQTVTDHGINQVLAIVGLRGIQRFIANLIKPGAYFAKDVEDAKEWLTSQ